MKHRKESLLLVCLASAALGLWVNASYTHNLKLQPNISNSTILLIINVLPFFILSTFVVATILNLICETYKINKDWVVIIIMSALIGGMIGVGLWWGVFGYWFNM